MKKNTKIALGFDCDRPRGAFIKSLRGQKMAEIKLASLEKISIDLDQVGVDRTYFICGQFLESMVAEFGKDRIKSIFQSNKSLIEIADHTYSHSLLKKIPVRPDKKIICANEAIEEFDKNSILFHKIFDLRFIKRGYRAPLGHYKGLEGEYTLLDLFKKKGIIYISSDCRDKKHSLNPSIKNNNNTPRQPYYYSNGLLEIPSHGWQDTVFGCRTKTPIFEEHPNSYEEILKYYKTLFNEASDLANENNCNFYITLTLHPYNIALYSKNRNFLLDIHSIAKELQIGFCKYKDIYYYYKGIQDSENNY